jgi:hypothetical protein
MTSDQLGQPHQLCTGLGGLLLGQVGVGGQHAHLEAGGAARNRPADLAETDDAERLATQLAAGVPAALPLAGTD